jgi:hypothetical protein
MLSLIAWPKMAKRRTNGLLALVLLVAVMSGCAESESGDQVDDGSARNPGSELAFYDWSANLLGPARTLNRFSEGHYPGAAKKELRELRQRWIESGRAPSDGYNRDLIAEGAEPTRALALRIAESEQGAGGAPQGAIVLSQQAMDSNGESVPGLDNRGFFVINDDPEVDGGDIVSPTAGVGLEGEPVVTFGFTKRGETAFRALTRRIAARGQAESLAAAVRCSPDCESDNLWDTFAIVFSGRILERPSVNFLEYPDGIDGRTGFQIQGGLTKAQARSLATALSD